MKGEQVPYVPKTPILPEWTTSFDKDEPLTFSIVADLTITQIRVETSGMSRVDFSIKLKGFQPVSNHHYIELPDDLRQQLLNFATKAVHSLYAHSS